MTDKTICRTTGTRFLEISFHFTVSTAKPKHGSEARRMGAYPSAESDHRRWKQTAELHGQSDAAPNHCEVITFRPGL
jgi:hypothetical protein